ncbi:MAG TPA: OmpH family outer membrane protein [Anaeromyxobacter sp.]|nr:OmpH family outer membrane protein [Anaeromyxobacter sp.]
MKTALRIAPVALALALSPVARADTKLGYVDLQRALREVDEGRVATQTLQKDKDEKQHQLDAKKDEFEKLKNDFERQATVMSEQAKKDKAGELDRKAGELQQLFMALQKSIAEGEEKAMRGIIDRMQGIAKEIAEADGFTMVLEKNSSGIFYAPPSLDLTNELVRKYNARYPVGGGAAPAKKAEAPKAAAPVKK